MWRRASGTQRPSVLLAALLTGLLAACNGGPQPVTSTLPSPSSLVLSSPAFGEGEPIPRRYTCDGEDESPPLAWDGVPDGAQAFALVVHDPDAGGFIHWVLTDIPGDLRELPEGQGDVFGAPGQTSFGRSGWGGPCPPSGEHRYVFTLYALTDPISVGASPDADEVRAAVEDRLLGSAELTGVYRRDG